MKYVALLRGINVGGNNSVSMTVLKEAFEKDGYTDVKTYINSGNVIFNSIEKDLKKLTSAIEELLSKTFTYQARVVIKSQTQFEKIVAAVPKDWNTKDDIRCYVAFLSSFVTPSDIAEISLREGVDRLDIVEGALFMTTKTSGLTKSHFSKLAGKKIYKEMTIRNYNTTKKLLAMMEES